MKNIEKIWEIIEEKKDNYIKLSDIIFDNPETLYKEFKSVKEHTKF